MTENATNNKFFSKSDCFCFKLMHLSMILEFAHILFARDLYCHDFVRQIEMVKFPFGRFVSENEVLNFFVFVANNKIYNH